MSTQATKTIKKWKFNTIFLFCETTLKKAYDFFFQKY